jgi:proteasome lid subunit RPN8/RPN11
MNEKGKLDKLMGYILGTDKKLFHEVHIDQEVVDEIIGIAREAYPNEFVAMLQGKIKNQILHIDGLIFLPGETSNQGAVMKVFMMPLIDDIVGSVHSHPGYNASPSNADRYFFSKNGFFHLIIGQPYNENSIYAYDSFGDFSSYKII